MIRPLPLFSIGLALLAGCTSPGETLEREVGEFDLRLGRDATRSMAHGLVQPASTGVFHGGLDLSHASGWYTGQWSPSAGISAGSELEVNSYLGYASQPVADMPGYELGVIHYSFPGFSEWNRNQYYAGLNLAGHQLGAALSSAAERTDSTLYLDLGRVTPFGVGVRMQYRHHVLETPRQLDDGESLRVFGDWSLNLSRPWLGIQLDLSYSDSRLRGCDIRPGCDGLLQFKAERPLY